MRGSTPFDDIEQLFERMNRQFGGMGGFSPGEGWHAIDVDVADYDDEYVVVADLPGFDREDIDLRVDEDALTIRAERHHEVDEGSEAGAYLRRERRSESLSRTVTLPEAVREDDAGATYRNGVLTVTLPKQAVSAPDDSHRIDIE